MLLAILWGKYSLKRMFWRGYRPHWVIGGLTSLRLAPALVFCPPPLCPSVCPHAAPRQTSWRGRRPWSCSPKKTSFLVLLQCLLAMLTWNSFHNIWHALYWIKLQHKHRFIHLAYTNGQPFFYMAFACCLNGWWVCTRAARKENPNPNPNSHDHCLYWVSGNVVRVRILICATRQTPCRKRVYLCERPRAT